MILKIFDCLLLEAFSYLWSADYFVNNNGDVISNVLKVIKDGNMI